MYNTECNQIGFKTFLFDAWASFFLLFCFLCACIKALWHVPLITFKSLHSFSIVCMKSLCHSQQKTLCEEGCNEELATSPSWKELKDTNLEPLEFVISEIEKNQGLKVTVFFLSTHHLIHYKLSQILIKDFSSGAW